MEAGPSPFSLSVARGSVESMSDQKLTYPDVMALGLDDWRFILDALRTRWRTGDFATGLRLTDAVGAAAEEANHHPDLDLRYGYLDVRLSSHDAGGVTERDVELARRIGGLAADLGVSADPASVTVLEYGIDTWDAAEIAPFWAAVWGVSPHDSGEILDPEGRLPTIWFQDTDRHEEPRQRWHPDVWVPAECAQDRIVAAVEAGGTIVDDSEAPSFTVLADRQGNRICVCTAESRD